MADLAELLRKSLSVRTTATAEPVRDLKAVVTELSAAVESVTDGRLKVVLQSLRPKPGYGPTFALTLCFPDEERIVCVLAVRTVVGYELIVWPTYELWDTQRRDPTQDHPPLVSATELRDFVQKLVSRSESEFVRLIAYEIAAMQEEAGELAGSGAK